MLLGLTGMVVSSGESTTEIVLSWLNVDGGHWWQNRWTFICFSGVAAIARDYDMEDAMF